MTPEREQRITNVLNHRQPNIVVVMENVHDPHNIMAVARSCDSIGVQSIYVIQDETKDGFNRDRQGSKSSGSANKWLNFIDFSSTKKCLTHLKDEGYQLYSTHLSAEAKEIYDVDFTQKIALIFGNEKYGVSKEALSLSDGNFIIPQVGMIKSLNISVACAISLYEAFRQRKAAGLYNNPQLSETDYQQYYNNWTDPNF